MLTESSQRILDGSGSWLEAPKLTRQPGKRLAHYFRYLAHAIVVRSIANIKYFAVNGFGGRLQHCDNRTRNVQPRLATGVGSQLVSSPSLWGCARIDRW